MSSIAWLTNGDMPAPRALDTTRDLLPLYVYGAGRSRIPPAFHQWMAYSMVAACLGNRVCLEQYRDQPLHPNLYVFLIGPSGTGKSAAIATGRKFLDDPVIAKVVYPLSGLKVTAEYLVDAMARRTRAGEPATVYLLTSEASTTIGRGDRADSFIRHVTEMFTGREVAMEGTVGRGTRVIRHYCLNWVAGTTIDWLNDSVRRQDISGGFFARVIPVVGESPTDALATPEYPPDYDEVVEHLRERFLQLTTISGCFTWSDQAHDAFQRWVEDRPRPSNDLYRPSHDRRPELVLKVAMCRAVMDDPLNLVIRRHHLRDAISHVSEACRSLPLLVERAAETQETEGLIWLSEAIRRLGRISHRQLVSLALRRGIAPMRVNTLVTALVQTGRVERVPSPMGTYYLWLTRRYPKGDDG